MSAAASAERAIRPIIGCRKEEAVKLCRATKGGKDDRCALSDRYTAR
jgi:hypothetical protein